MLMAVVRLLLTLCVVSAQVLTQPNTVIPASCWNAATNDSLSWASRPISNDTNFVRHPPHLGPAVPLLSLKAR